MILALDVVRRRGEEEEEGKGRGNEGSVKGWRGRGREGGKRRVCSTPPSDWVGLGV